METWQKILLIIGGLGVGYYIYTTYFAKAAPAAAPPTAPPTTPPAPPTTPPAPQRKFMIGTYSGYGAEGTYDTQTGELKARVWSREGCPSCVVQVLVYTGADIESKWCAYNGVPGKYPGSEFTFNVRAKAGVVPYVRIAIAAGYGCEDAEKYIVVPAVQIYP